MNEVLEGSEGRDPKVNVLGIAVEPNVAHPMAYRQSRTSGPHFEWSSYLNLLDKARRDLTRLRTRGVDSDGLFNFLATAGHLFDWIRKDPRATGKLKEEAGTHVYGDPPGPIRVIHLLCTSAKHMRPSAASRQDPKVQLGYRTMGVLSLGRGPRLRGRGRRSDAERSRRGPRGHRRM